MKDIPSGHPFRCLVVVNRAIDRDLELPERHRDVEILYRENVGYNIGAWEHGWRVAAPAEYYLFLQEECRIVRPDWLGSSTRLLADPKVGLVGEVDGLAGPILVPRRVPPHRPCVPGPSRRGSDRPHRRGGSSDSSRPRESPSERVASISSP